MSTLDPLLQEVFRQYGLIGLLILFLILGPGFTFFRTRSIRVQSEAKAQEILNTYAQKERERADRLEEKLDEAYQQLARSEDEVAQLRLRLSKAQIGLDELPRLKQRVRRLSHRVTELEGMLVHKQAQIEALQQNRPSDHKSAEPSIEGQSSTINLNE